MGMRRPQAAPISAYTYGRSSAQGVSRTTNSCARSKKFRMSSSKSAPASTSASSKNGVAPQASISRATCLATHVSALLWLMNTNLLFLLAASSTDTTILR